MTGRRGLAVDILSRHDGNLYHCLLTALRFQGRGLGMAGRGLKR